MQTETPTTSVKSPVVTPYVAAWAGLAFLALAYLAVLVTSPDLLAQYWPASPPASAPETNEGQRADTLAEVQSLKTTVEQLQTDVSKLKSDVGAQATLTEGWEQRISVLEAQAEPVVAATTKAPSSPMKQVGNKPSVPAKPVASAVPGVQVVQQAGADIAETALSGAARLADPATGATGSNAAGAAPATVVKPAQPAQVKPKSDKQASAKPADTKILNAPTPAPVGDAIETGSVSNSGIAFAPPVVSSAPKAVGVVVGNGPSVDSLRLSWSLLSDRHAASLGKLEPRYTAGVDANGLTYDLLAGPVKSPAEAAKLCKDLAAKAIPCRVAEFGGEAL